MVVLVDWVLGFLFGGLINGSVGFFFNKWFCFKIFCILVENEVGEDKGFWWE